MANKKETFRVNVPEHIKKTLQADPRGQDALRRLEKHLVEHPNTDVTYEKTEEIFTTEQEVSEYVAKTKKNFAAKIKTHKGETK